MKIRVAFFGVILATTIAEEWQVRRTKFEAPGNLQEILEDVQVRLVRRSGLSVIDVGVLVPCREVKFPAGDSGLVTLGP